MQVGRELVLRRSARRDVPEDGEKGREVGGVLERGDEWDETWTLRRVGRTVHANLFRGSDCRLTDGATEFRRRQFLYGSKTSPLHLGGGVNDFLVSETTPKRRREHMVRLDNVRETGFLPERKKCPRSSYIIISDSFIASG